MQLKTLSIEDIPKYKNELLELYDPLKKRREDYWKSLKNSTFIVAAFEGEKIIGISRIITDMYMCAMIFDVLIEPDLRNQ